MPYIDEERGQREAASVGPYEVASAARPVDGASGTLAGIAETGSTLVNTTLGMTFINVGTKAVPVWSTSKPWINAGVPSAATNEVWTLTLTGPPTAGDFTITHDGDTTAAIAWNAAAAAVELAVEALASIGAGNATCAGGALPGAAVTITGTGANAGLPFEPMTADDTGLDVAGITLTKTTPADPGTFGGIAKKGDILIDTTNAKAYINGGSDAVASWKIITSA